MADLGNLFFSLGLDTKQIDTAWDAALKKYGQKAQVDLKLNTGDLKTIKAQYAELNAKNKLAQDAEYRGKLNTLKLDRERLKTEELINTQKARTAAIQDKTTAAVKRTNSEISTQNRLVQNLNTLAASYISIFAGARLVRQLMTISGEFETQKIALRAILQDLQGADGIFEQIKQLAVKSPFQFKDLVSFTKQLSAFSVPINELFDTTKMLADVSAGLGVGMDRLVLAYGQIRAASVLRGQELRQLTEAGIPVIEELRKKFAELGETGLTASDIFDKISKRLVPFEMIKEMFEDLTSEGGKFYNMQEVLAESLTGKISNLTDAYQIMLAEIGERGEGILKGSVDTLRSLITNYEKVAKILTIIIATYGAYRATIIATRALEAASVMAGNIKAWFQLAAGIKTAKDAQLAFNLATKANPLGLFLSILTAIGTAIWAFRENTDAATESLGGLTKAQKDASAKFDQQRAKIKALESVIKNSNVANEHRKKALNELKSIIPTYNAQLDEEGRLINNNTDAIKEYLVQLEKQIKMKAAQKELEEAYMAERTLQKQLDENRAVKNKKTTNTAYYDRPLIDVASWFGMTSIQQAEDAVDDTTKKLQEVRRVISDLNREIETSSQALALSGLMDDMPEDSALGDKLSKDIENLETARKRLLKLEADLYSDAQRAKIDAMEDGWIKEQALRSYQHERNIEKIKERAKELLEAQVAVGGDGSSLTPENQTLITGMLGSENTRYEREQSQVYDKLLSNYQDYNDKRKQLEKDYNEEVLQLSLQMNGANSKEISKALGMAFERYTEKLKQLADDEINQIMKSSPLLVRIFSDAANMGQKRLKDTIKLTKQLLAYISGEQGAVLPQGLKPEDAEKMVGDVEDINRVMRQLQKLESESRNRIDYPMSGFVYGFKKMKEAADLAKKSIEGLSEEQKRARQDEIDALRTQATKDIAGGMTSLASVLNSVGDAMDRIGEATSNMKLKETAEQIKGAASVIQSAGEGAKSGSWIGAIIGAATSMITQTIDAFAIAKEEEAEFRQNQTDWLNNYKNMLLEIKNSDYESIFGTEVLRRSGDAYRNATLALRNYKDELSRRTAPEYEKEYIAQGAAMFFGSAQGSLKRITAESKLAVDAYKKGYTDIQRMMVKTKDQSGWANFFGKQDEFTALKDLAPELWDEGGEFNVAAAKAFLDANTQITDEQRKQIENLIKQKELYEENINIIKEDLKDTFGDLGNSLLDSIVNAIETGADSFDMFEDAGSVAIEKLGRKLMYEIFLADRFKKFEADMLKTYEDTTLDTPEKVADAQANILDRFFDETERDWENMRNWGEMYKQKAAEKGFNIWEDEGKSASTLGGAIQASVTENTANLLGGYINGIRADGAKRTMLAEQMLPLVSNINDTMGNGLAHLAAISSNTFRTANGIDRLVEKVDALTTPNGSTKLNTTVKL